MNSLSWLLYAADVAQGIKVGGGIAATFMVVGGVAAMPMSFLAGETYYFYTEDEKEEARARPGIIRDVAKKVIIGGVILLSVGAVLPSRTTIMLIAASEVGETILASPQAQEIGGEAGELATDSLRVLRNFINEQLGTPKSEATP